MFASLRLGGELTGVHCKYFINTEVKYAGFTNTAMLRNFCHVTPGIEKSAFRHFEWLPYQELLQSHMCGPPENSTQMAERQFPLTSFAVLLARYELSVFIPVSARLVLSPATVTIRTPAYGQNQRIH